MSARQIARNSRNGSRELGRKRQGRRGGDGVCQTLALGRLFWELAGCSLGDKLQNHADDQDDDAKGQNNLGGGGLHAVAPLPCIQRASSDCKTLGLPPVGLTTFKVPARIARCKVIAE